MNSIIHWLLTDSYWVATQGVVQNSTLAFWSIAGAGYWLHKSCKAHPWCWRPGQHEVDGTAVKVCRRHHTLTAHEAVFEKHSRVDHPDKLSHGESHVRGRE